jgi:hypothetical protein
MTGHQLHAIDIMYNTLTTHYTPQIVGVTLVGPQTRHVLRQTGAFSLLSRLQFAKGITFVLGTSSPICASFIFSGTGSITLKFSKRTVVSSRQMLAEFIPHISTARRTVWAGLRLRNYEEFQVLHNYNLSLR